MGPAGGPARAAGFRPTRALRLPLVWTVRRADTENDRHDILLTMFYAPMTHCCARSCTLLPMRNAFLTLLSFLTLACGSLRAQDGALALQAATDRTIYVSATPTVYIEAKILPQAQPTQDATSVRNIALVLDRSGSMAGEPVQALRQAVTAALGTLAERDVVSIVLFGSEVETVLEARRRDQIVDLDTLLARIEPAGGSALYDALNQGAAQLRRYAASSTINHLVLVTDGPATKGPRERDDFMRLAELFAREGITLSTIGLGEEFEEDLLANLARTGNGRFHFAAKPGELAGVLQAELGRLRTPLAQDVVLSIEFHHGTEEIEPAGWEVGEIDDRTVTFRFPGVFAGQDVGVLAGARIVARGDSCQAAVVRLRWKDVATGEPHAVERRLSLYIDGDSWLSRKSINRDVIHSAVDAMISEGMQKSIEQLDKGDFRRALRELSRARDRARDVNNDLEDAGIAARIQVLESYLAEVQARGLNQLDRKILRSGLRNQFEIPTEEPKDK